MNVRRGAGAGWEKGAGEQPHKCSEGRESRTTLGAATVVVFPLPPLPTPIRALFVCAQEPGQSCANSEVELRSVRKFGGRTGIGIFTLELRVPPME